MAQRRRIPMKKSKKSFTRNAQKIHRKNGMGRPMRGGIRL